MRPQTNGMVERFNGRIEDVLQSHRFRSGEDLEQTILRYVRLYNGQLPQSVLQGRTPIDALKEWHRDKPALFKKRPYNHTGCDIQALENATESAPCTGSRSAPIGIARLPRKRRLFSCLRPAEVRRQFRDDPQKLQTHGKPAGHP